MRSHPRPPAARRASLVSLLLVVLVSAPATATVVVPMDVEQLAAAATTVVHGTVVATRVEDDGGRLFTRVDVRVREELKTVTATAPDRVTVRVVGGSRGGYTQIVPGAPRLAVGDEVVLFLWSPGPDQPFRPLGLAMGTFHVQRRGKVADAVSRRGGLASSRADSAGGDEVPDLHLPLTTLLQRIRAAGATQ